MRSAFLAATTSVGVPGMRNCSIVGDDGPAVDAPRGEIATSERTRTTTRRFTVLLQAGRKARATTALSPEPLALLGSVKRNHVHRLRRLRAKLAQHRRHPAA